MVNGADHAAAVFTDGTRDPAITDSLLCKRVAGGRTPRARTFREVYVSSSGEVHGHADPKRTYLQRDFLECFVVGDHSPPDRTFAWTRRAILRAPPSWDRTPGPFDAEAHWTSGGPRSASRSASAFIAASHPR